MQEIRRLVVAVDFSEHSHRAVEAARYLAEKFAAEIDVVHAFEAPVPPVTPYELVLPDNFIAEAREAVLRELDGLTRDLAASGLVVRSHLRDPPAHVAIAALAEETAADLVVMGTRGNTGLKHVLLGSVAERTLRHAPCSVLTVK